MKPHPRIRKTVKWGGLATLILVVALWIVSGRGIVRWIDPDRIVSVECGTVIYLSNLAKPGTGSWRVDLSWVEEGSKWKWLWSFELRRYPELLLVQVPLWAPGLVVLVATAAAWAVDAAARRRARAGLCPKCGYDRTGIPLLAPCPECGSGSESAGAPPLPTTPPPRPARTEPDKGG